MNADESWLLKEKYHGEKTEGFFTDSDRLRNGEPLAYVIGHIPFLSTIISLDSHPLIPRPETEFWVEKAISEIHTDVRLRKSNIHVLDLCAGSGCIGVAILKAIPDAQVDFVELDATHHSTIRKNIEINHIDGSRTQIFGGDLYENITGEYDYILTNPPYIDPEVDRTEPSVKNYEPHLALYGGTHGLELISRIITEGSNYLTENGTLYIEHEPEQSTAILELGESHGFAVITEKDQYDRERYSMLAKMPKPL